FFVKNRNTNTAKIYNYDVPTHASSALTNITPLDLYMQAIVVVTNYSLIAGVIDDNSTNNAAHSVKIYDISLPSSPLVVSNFYFLTFGAGTNSSNPNFGGCVDPDGSRIVPLNTQNGIVALQIVVNNPPPWTNALFLLPANHRQFSLN